jgi:hypothetical protein
MEPDVQFEDLRIDLPDYVKPGGGTSSQPFSRSSHNLFRPEDLGSSGNGDGTRTDYFKRHLVRIFHEIGKPVPYRFTDARGGKRSMDGGCLKFVGPKGQDVAEFILADSYIAAVRPKLALLREFPEPTSVAADIEKVARDPNLTETQRTQLINARVGQGEFRRGVLERWNNRCALTGCDLAAVVRASHIVPWRDASNAERLSPANGLPLVATVDALFDAGLISFDDDGVVLFARRLNAEHQKLVVDKRLRGELNGEICNYLARHRRANGFPAK